MARHRRFGPRRPRTPFAALSVLAPVGCVLTLLLPLFASVPWGSAVRAALLVGGVGAWAVWMRRRAGLPDLDEEIRADPRPHVLYLRTFGKESVYFSRKELPEGLNRAQRIGRRLVEDQFESLQTLEKFLGPELRLRVGPFIALGDPTDRVPREGAARTWSHDRTWWEEFLRLMPSARCIVVSVHESEGLAQELQQVRAAGRQRRLFLFTPPHGLDGRGSRVVALNNRLPGHQPERWEKVVPFMKDLGYSLPVTHPGPGAVIGFDHRGRARVLATGATTAAGYVTPLLAALEAA